VIGKVSRGRDAGGLLRYLFGPGRANEHLAPRLVASWRGEDAATLAELEPAVVEGRRDVAPLAARLTLPLQLQPEVDRPVWQCSMRTADGDRRLSDAEWAEVARDLVDRTGFAPRGDAAACRWVAVRHADDHIHIAVVLARMDGHPVEVFRDWPKVHAAARAAERRLGLEVVAAPSKTLSVPPRRAEMEKTRRTATTEPARRWLTRQVRDAAADATAREGFADLLARSGVMVMWRESQHTQGQITGYAVGRPGDVDAVGRQVWFGGSKLAPDLSLPRLEARWAQPATTRSPQVVLGLDPHTGARARAAHPCARPRDSPDSTRSPRTAAAELSLLARLAPDEQRAALLIAADVLHLAGIARGRRRSPTRAGPASSPPKQGSAADPPTRLPPGRVGRSSDR
jgi:hypothetical protein